MHPRSLAFMELGRDWVREPWVSPELFEEVTGVDPQTLYRWKDRFLEPEKHWRDAGGGRIEVHLRAVQKWISNPPPEKTCSAPPRPSPRIGFIYLVEAPELGRVKIGFSKQPEIRFGNSQPFCPTEIRLSAYIRGTDSGERALHRRYAERRVIGEWFHDCEEIRREFDLPTIDLEESEMKLQLGQVLATPGALNALGPEEVMRFLRRHSTGDWGDVDSEDKETNDTALELGGRVLSAYHTENDTKIWIITEHDRSVTTILLPEEY